MNRAAFQTAVEFAARVTTGAIPILECVHIVSDGTRGTVTGSNMDLFCRHQFDCDVTMNVCVRAQRLKAVLDSIKAEEISVECSALDMHIRAGTAHFIIPLFTEIGHFPSWFEVNGSPFDVPCEALKRILPFAHTEKAAGIKHAVWMDNGYVVACDGRRMGSIKAEISGSCILSVAAAKLLSGLEGTMRFGDGKFSASGDQWDIAGKLVEGNVIKWQKMIPVTDRSYPIPDSFRDVLSCAVKLYVDNDKTFNYRFTLKDGTFRCQNYSDKTDMDGEIDIFANATDVLEAIRQSPGEAAMKLGDSQHPIVIESGDFVAVCARIREIQPPTAAK